MERNKSGLFSLLAIIAFAIAGVVILWVIVSCSDGCTPETTRCNGTRVEICDQEDDWDLVMDCSEIEPGDWVCCEDGYYDDAHGCVLEGDCGADGGVP